MIRKVVVATILGVLMCASGAIAQEGRWQEISVQGTGFFTKDSSGNGINQHATDTGGFLLSYRYHFNRWLAADASYGYARNTQQNFTSSSQFGVQANMHQATGALVVTAPHRIFRLAPTSSPVPVPSCLTLPVMQADLFPEHRVSRKLRLSTEAAPTTTSAGTSHFAPNTVVSSTGVLTLIWQRYTPARPRTQPSPPPVSSFASETTVP